MKPEGLSRFSAAMLATLLGYGILTIWVEQRWALTVYQSGILLLAAVWTAWLTVRPFPVTAWAALPLLAALSVWGGVQAAAGLTVSRWETWNSVLDWSTRAALFFISAQALAGERLRRMFLSALLYFGFVLSALATVQMFTSAGKIFWLFPSGYDNGVLGPFVSRNQYAAFIEMILPLALYRALTHTRHSFRYWVMAAVMVASAVAGASRAGTVLVVTEALAVVLLAWKRGIVGRRTAGLALIQFVLLAAVTTAVVGWDVLARRVQDADPYIVRRELLQSSIAMVRDRPWTGFGLGAWATAYPQYALYDDGQFVNQAHNDWAQWAVEGGLPFVAVVLAISAAIAVPAWRALWGIGLIAVLLHAFVDYPMQQRPALAGWFFALAGAAAAQAAGNRRSNSPGDPVGKPAVGSRRAGHGNRTAADADRGSGLAPCVPVPRSGES